ncbi:MAG: hypothetical protein FJ087_15220 [Deltaproteobacteria bacterium]|nr:hypothetical protein [Deltaproteobacteria bacterium]
MRKHGWAIVFVASLFAGMLLACGGGEGAASCDKDESCGRGKVCQSGACQALECTSFTQCLTGPNGGERTCAPIDGMDASKMWCTARECSDTRKCADAAASCIKGLCIAGGTTDDVPVQGDESTTETPATDTPPAETGDDPIQCKPCPNGSGDCTPPLTCSAAGSGKFCLKPCGGTAECLPGYVCYPTSSAGKQCLPISNDCKKCAYEGCGAGQCCDLVTGECGGCKNECEQCTYDFQCATGMRCFKKQSAQIGVCVKECANGPCASGYQCADNADKIKVCQPDENTCKLCPDPNKPYQTSAGVCVECLNSVHCANKPNAKFCSDNKCQGQVCGGGQKSCSDNKCHQCCEDADCPKDATHPGKCTNYSCEGDNPQQDCINAGMDCASDPYLPICCTGGGTPQCCQCNSNADCDALEADQNCICTNNNCFDDTTGELCGGTPSQCASSCTEDAECPASATGTPLKCAAAGFCYDESGSCDGMTSCCPAGETCFDLLSILFGGMMPGGGGIPGIPGGGMPSMGIAYCSCIKGTCVNGKSCTDMNLICSLGAMLGLCPGGTLPADVPDKVCFDFADLLGGIGI